MKRFQRNVTTKSSRYKQCYKQRHGHEAHTDHPHQSHLNTQKTSLTLGSTGRKIRDAGEGGGFHGAGASWGPTSVWKTHMFGGELGNPPDEAPELRGRGESGRTGLGVQGQQARQSRQGLFHHIAHGRSQKKQGCPSFHNTLMESSVHPRFSFSHTRRKDSPGTLWKPKTRKNRCVLIR